MNRKTMFGSLKDKAASASNVFGSKSLKGKKASSQGPSSSLDSSIQEERKEVPLRRSKTAPNPSTLSQKDVSTVLRLTIHEGMGLLALDKTGTSDPYVVFGLVSSSKKYRTNIVSRNCNPTWEETFTLKLKPGRGGPNDYVLLEIVDKDYLTSDDPMGTVLASLEPLHTGLPFTKWYDVKHPKHEDKTAGKIRVTLQKTSEEESSLITKSLRNKMFATLTMTQMKMREWGVEAEVSIEVVFGIFKMTMSVAAQANEKNLDDLQLEMTNLRREIANTPTDEEEEQEMEMLGADSKKQTKFEKVLFGSMDKLRTALHVSKAQFVERGLSGSVGAGICFKAYAIEFEVMLTITIHSSETVLKNRDDEQKKG